ncbi:hypothetical protein RAMLITH_07695 [Ramlibacter sp. RBP-2]|uniref:Aminoglycoside phosphotransferase domain-containing protein n=1 Tax=Ramlibacter lithotrophicus TaxID=2606681 RepID=A0A7X6DER2_9BURK|nr:hypothetical protein [Ramlibacter lithotrophicus]NKE65703.1 hypothetical protein [Ramlibacter lithotrophicus]
MDGAPLTGPGQRSLPQPRASLEAKVAALRQPSAWPVPPASVEAIETHMSWVFLTPQQAFKLKKPVRSDGLDFGTLERRRFFCEEEVRLNRRLAPSVYLDVLPLRADANGALGLWPEGEVVDWLVVMHRLPAGRMLDRLLATGAAQAGDMRRLAALLSGFYANLPPVLHDPEVYCERLAREIAHHEARLCDPQLAFPSGAVRPVCADLRLFLQHRRDRPAARVRAGRVVEGHGDLRPEHVWLGEPPAIIDCLEFSTELRTVDSADELAFVALECERAGAADLGHVLLQEFAALSGDAVPRELTAFYRGLRGCVRASIALWHLKEPRYRGSPVWRERAGQYLQLAASHAHACVQPSSSSTSESPP